MFLWFTFLTEVALLLLTRISIFRLPCNCLLENYLIEIALQLLMREFSQYGCLATAYLRISSLRLPCGSLLKNFLIEAALWLLPWEFPHWGCLGTNCLKISSWRLLIYWNFILEDTLLRLHDWGGMFEAYSGKLPLLGRLPQMGRTLLFFH